MTSDNVKMTGYQYITNTSPTTFHSAGTGTIAAGASFTYNIPLSLSFLVKLDFFLGNLKDLGLAIQVYSRIPRVYITGAMGEIALNASWLRLDAEYYLSAADDAKLAEQKSKPHQWKFLNTDHQTQSVAMTAGNIYPIQFVSLRTVCLVHHAIEYYLGTLSGMTQIIQVCKMEFLPGMQLPGMSTNAQV